jgi:O-antigen ligase
MITWARVDVSGGRLWSATVLTAALAAAVGALAAAQPSLVGRGVLGAAVAVFFVRHPYALVLVWGALAMFGDNRLDELGGQSIFGALTYVSLPCFFIVAAPRVPRLVRQQPWLGVWIAFVLLVLVNLPRSPLALPEAIRQFIGFPATVGILTLAATELRSLRRFVWLTWAILVPSVGVAAYGCYQYFAGVGGLDSQGVYRVFSVFAWTNTLAFFLIVPIGWAAFVVRDATRLRVRLAGGSALIVLTAAEFFTFGRGGWLGAGLALAGPLLIAGPPARVLPSRPLFVVAGLAAIAVAVSLVPGLDLSARIEDVANIQGRALIWDYVFRQALEDPIIGQGFWAVDALTSNASDELVSQGVHNAYLMIFFDYGVIGLTIFCAAWIVLSAQFAMLLRTARRSSMHFILAAGCATLGVLVYSGSGLELVDFAPSIYLWLMVGAAMSQVWASAPSHAGPLELARDDQPAQIESAEQAAHPKQLQPLGTA